MKVLLLADECNPDWPSLPIVGWKYAKAIAAEADIVLATHVRNRESIAKQVHDLDIRYVDTEWIAGPMFRLARWLRGGEEVAWSTSMMMYYLPYLAFERGAYRHFGGDLSDFDIVHRITPMSPSLPSWIAHKCCQPFVIGPLNGNLDWPVSFVAEQAREKETLRRLRGFYKMLPYARSTYDRASAVLTAFSHTRADLTRVEDARIISMPEIGIDPLIFHDGEQPAGQRGGNHVEFLYAGRLVPYKLPEIPIRAFAASKALQRHHLHIVGDGPERERMEAVISQHELQDCVTMHGRKSQAEVAEMMRRTDALVFPSIRELGAGVVIEAMACGQLVLVSDYGAPGDLAAEGRGLRVPMAPFDSLLQGFTAQMESCLQDRPGMAEMAARGRSYAENFFPWSEKGRRTVQIYEALLEGNSLSGLGY